MKKKNRFTASVLVALLGFLIGEFIVFMATAFTQLTLTPYYWTSGARETFAVAGVLLGLRSLWCFLS